MFQSLLLAMVLIFSHCTWCSGPVLMSKGLKPPSERDGGLVFYMELVKWDPSLMLQDLVTDQQCCLWNPQFNTCESVATMDAVLSPGKFANLYVIFPTMYPYGISGHCRFHIHFHNSSSVLQDSIRFELIVPDQHNQSTNPFFTGTMRPSLLCPTQDLDPFHGCQPVDCVLKYHGYRNIFNTSSLLCENPVPCGTRNGSSVVKVFDPIHNQCLERNSSHRQHQGRQPRVVCLHGTLLDGQCLCHPGWGTPYEDNQQPESTVPIMCHVKIQEETSLPVTRQKHHSHFMVYFCCYVVIMLLLVSWMDVYIYQDQYWISKEDFRPKAVRQTKYACAIARRPHYGVFINELDFKEGDVIYNLWKTEDKSIWLGTVNNKRGTFPASFVEFIKK